MRNPARGGGDGRRDRMGAMYDIHCHLLPGVDDGSKSWEMTDAMLAVARKDGIRHIVCTPHANDRYQYDRQALKAMLGRLGKAAGPEMTFSLGCDFHLSFENIQQAMQDPDQFTISGTDYLLVEFSDYSIPPGLSEALRRFVSMGITPVVTHPERNMILKKRPEQIVQLAQMGCAIQITANSITGHWGETSRKVCQWLLDREAAHVVATDAHDPSFRPPVLSPARQWLESEYGEDVAQALVVDNPRAVVENQELPYFPSPRQA
jgi:protein-tyrosine phosphatase